MLHTWSQNNFAYELHFKNKKIPFLDKHGSSWIRVHPKGSVLI